MENTTGEMVKLDKNKYLNRVKSKKLAIGLAFLESREEKKNFIWGYLSCWLDGFPNRPITEGSPEKYWCEKTKVGANFATKVNVNGYKGTISKVDELVEHFENTSDGKNAKLDKVETEAIQRGVRELPIEGKDYWRFGPYKITGILASEKIRKLVVTETNSKEKIHDYKIVFYEDQKPKVGKYENIRNNKRFYLCIPKSRSGEFNFKFTTNTAFSEQEVRAELYFLESTAYNWQNLVIAEAKGRNAQGKTISTSISVKTPGSGKFKIIKKDKYNNARLSGAKFLIFYFEGTEKGAHLHNGSYNKFWNFDYVSPNDPKRQPGTPEYTEYHKKDEKGDLVYGWATRKYVGRSGSGYTAEEISKEEAIKKGYIFETDASGEICLDGLEFPENRYYCAIEYEPPVGYKWDPAFDTYWSGGDNYFVLNPNQDNPGVYVTEVPNITTNLCNLNLEKVNQMDHTIKLKGIGFRFYNDEYGWLSGSKEVGYSYSFDETKAEEYKTNDVGRIELNDIVSEGNWYCYENPDTLPYGYELLGDGTHKIGKIENNSTKQYVVENEQKYVKLSGFVWLDQVNSKSGDGNTRNDLFRYGDSDNTDLLFDGIEVRLKNRTTGETVKTAITGKSESELYKKGHGEYQFTDVETKELEDLYIEFEYDGLTYQNVICPDINKINQYINSEGEPNPNYDVTTANVASKATEGNKREQFNKTFSVIEGKGSDNSTRGIRKGEDGTIFDDLEYEKKENHTMALKNGEYALHENEGYIATSNKGKYPIQADTSTSGYNIRSNFNWGQEEIGSINLGLYKREQPDTRLRKDLHNVRLAINGQEHTYEYAQRYNSDGEYKEERKDLNVGVRFKNSYKENSYERPIYKADYKYINKQDDSKELKVYVTYQLKIENESTNLKTTIKSIADYYDKEYELVSVGSKLTEEGNTTDDIARERPEYNETYNKVLIKDIEIGAEAGKAKDIYVQFKLSRKQVEEMLNGQKKSTLYNIAEINSYSVLDKNGGIYAGIDIDSNPGNCEPGNIETYEDDTDSAPDLKIKPTHDREMTGIVFEDIPLVENGQDSGGVMTGCKREGNGIYEEEEEGIKDVKVKLKDKDSGMVYYSKTASEDGTYEIKKDDNKPEKDNEGQERAYTFELTKTNEKEEDNPNIHTLKKGEFYIIDFIPGNYVLTYIWEDKEYPVQNYKGTVYKEKDRQNNNKWWYVEQKYNDKGEKQNISEPRYSDARDNYETRKKIDKQITAINKDTKDNINQSYEDNGTIKDEDRKITTMESSTLEMEIGIEYKPAYTASKGAKYTYCIENIDFGIIERAKQHLVLNKYINKMKVTLANGQVIADLTRNQDNGKLEGENKGVTHMKQQPNIQPANGFAKLELDNELMQGTKLEIEYNIEAINKSELDYVDENFYMYGEIAQEDENTVVKITSTEIIDYLDKDWSVNTEQYNNDDVWNIKTIDENKENNISEYLKEDVYKSPESTIKDKTILYKKHLKNKELKPNDSNKIVLNASKMLSTTTDEISLDNETEEVAVNKTGGRDIETTPGNYIPGNALQEEDSSMAETVIVTPATGLNLNYILPIAIGVTAFIILGVGVIIIKKKAI